MLNWVLAGLKDLVIEQIKNHKDDVEKAILDFVKGLLDSLLVSGHGDTVKKIQSLVAEHPEV